MLKITNRIILFFFLFIGFTSLFFYVGNLKNFQDFSLNLIAFVILISSILAVIFDFYGFILLIRQAIKEKKAAVMLKFYLYLIPIIFQSLTLILFSAILFICVSIFSLNLSSSFNPSCNNAASAAGHSASLKV